jgi:hypothetical protein
MNERTIKLYKEATEFAYETVGKEHANKSYFQGVVAGKFAQLIVQECLDIASEVRGEPATDTHYVIGYDRACEKMISGIKEHFGVEE